ncbi:MAG: hypothetical protein ACTSUF_02150 [Candidatus Heimdallarchaeaceae archaeon]
MVQEQVVIVLKVLDEATGKLRAVQKSVQTTKKSLIHGSEIVSKSYRKIGDSWIQVSEKTVSGLRRFRMELLSIMFFGMQLKRFFGGFLKEALNTYMKITEGQTALGRAILRTQAAWEFFKFSLIEALQPLILWVTEIAIKFLDWASANPELMKLIGVLMIIGFVIGTLMFLVGVFGLGLQGLAISFGIAGTAGTISFGAILAAALPLLLQILVLVAVAYLLYKAWKENWGGIGSFLDGAVAVIVGGIKLIISYFIYIVDSLGWLADNWKAIWVGIQLIFHSVVMKILEICEMMINGVISGLNWIIAKYNEFAEFVGLPKKELLKQIDLTSKYAEKLEELRKEYMALATKAAESGAKIISDWRKRNTAIIEEIAEKSRKAWSRPVKPWGEVWSEFKSGLTGFIMGEEAITPSVTPTTPTNVSNINFSPVYNISGLTWDEINDIIEERDKRTMEMIERVSGGGA